MSRVPLGGVCVVGVVTVIGALSGCESRATPRGTPAEGSPAQVLGEAAPRIENLSKGTSRLGEYHAAAGDTAAAAGDNTAAAEAYARAAEAFRNDGVAIPTRIACHHGVALRRSASGDRGKSEEAARLLHQCVLGTPAGSDAVKTALQELAALEPLGFDPALLKRESPADKYLTLPPRLPTADQIALDVLGSPTKAATKLEQSWLAIVQGPEIGPMLLPCLETYWNATQKDDVAFAMAVTWKARWSEDAGDWVGGTLDLTIAPNLEGATHAAAECVKATLIPAAADLAKKGTGASWQEELQLTLRAKR